MIKVLLADDHSIVREGLRRIVEESADMEVVATVDKLLAGIEDGQSRTVTRGRLDQRSRSRAFAAS